MIDLLARCLVFRPENRITAIDALQSHFMREREDGTLTPLVIMEAPTPAPTKKTNGSILWAKGVASQPQGPVSWMGRDLKDALRLSKSKTIDRFQLKRPSLSSLRMRTQEEKKSASKEEGFDLPSIPMLSPIQMCSNGEPTRTASLVQNRMS
ncbi:hypothetical protein BCR43DRAFT_104999 [Syncephalastrum racemosum]|uniref:Protein kinase domain-containing protein n=1 Tax=Syncephalastrum racemosum TaxID=13706 RepID=A0A1X2H1N5_SYNRA|nr:hypothetical protein BCR43DRAFT_104999 [Syncephalastrum racemosum]